MTVLTLRQEAWFQTTKRLLAALVNEGLVDAKVEGPTTEGDQYLRLSARGAQRDGSEGYLIVKVNPGATIEERNREVLPIIQAGSLCPPVVFKSIGIPRDELDPGKIFSLMIPWLAHDASEDVLKEIAQQLQNSGKNQEMWLSISACQRLLDLKDTSIAWERSLVYGHPTHPLHRTCHSQLPLKTVDPENIPGMLTPDITFISIALTEVRFSGPFEELLQPLLRSLQIPGVPKGQTVVPCLTQQLPSILRRFPNAIILETIADSAYAQASLRTLTLRSDIGYPFQLKLSLACQITSALRTITPWSAMGGPRISKILVKFLPANLWVFREVASVTGSQADFDDAKHLSCILREDLEARAENNNEVLIIAAALTQQPHGGSQSYAEIIFGLKSVYQKQEWFRLYVQMLLELFLPPLVNHGIGLEAHGQNVVARVCRATGKVKGFAVRDFGGIRLHTPTLRRQGVKFDKMLSGWVVLTESMNDVLEKVHHSLLQNHIGFLLNSLCLERHDGWNIVRDVLEVVLSPVDGSPRNDIYKWFMNDTMLLKCFLRMRMQQKYRDYVKREVPNILLKGTDKWETLLYNYEPLLHCT